MNFNEQVDAIEEMIYSDERVKRLLHGYLLDKDKFVPDPWEELYTEGRPALLKLLTDSQRRKLSDIEGAYRHNLHHAFRFAFPRGLCAIFQQYYSDGTGETAFHDWVEEQLLTEPLARFNRGLLNRQNQCADFLSKLEEEADETAKEYIRNIKSVWDDRVYGMLQYGFYLGYRCGLAAIAEERMPQKLEELEKKILLTEFELKIIDTRYTQEALEENGRALTAYLLSERDAKKRSDLNHEKEDRP